MRQCMNALGMNTRSSIRHDAYLCCVFLRMPLTDTILVYYASVENKTTVYVHFQCVNALTHWHIDDYRYIDAMTQLVVTSFILMSGSVVRWLDLDALSRVLGGEVSGWLLHGRGRLVGRGDVASSMVPLGLLEEEPEVATPHKCVKETKYLW